MLSRSVELEVLQLVSQSVPSIGLQQITVTKRSAGVNITIVPMISTLGLCVPDALVLVPECSS